jgi:hypothetical protein
MIGNDVVDLDDEDSRASCRHPRFEARIFAVAERERAAACADPDLARATLWAAKESAYKLLRRRDPRAVFSPSRFVVHLVGDRSAVVDAGGRPVDVTFERGAGFVHAVALDEAAEFLCAVRRLDACDANGLAPGLAARRLALERIAPFLGVGCERLSIVRDARIPWLRADGIRLPGALSLSHHGRFVAFAWTQGSRGGQVQREKATVTPQASGSATKRSRSTGGTRIQQPMP